MCIGVVRAASLGIAGLLLLTGAGLAADLPKSQDPPFLKRFQGSEIVNYETVPFDALQIAAPDPKNSANWVLTPAEGQITRLVYHVPSGHTTLEVLRNYEQALKDANLTQVDERQGTTDLARDFLADIYHQSWDTNSDFNWTNLGRSGIQQFGYVTAKGTVGGRPVQLAITVGNYSHPVDVVYKSKIHFDADQPFVVVDVSMAKAVENQMVVVKAADIADALSSKGFIDLYGVYFDTDKTVVKPESTATLDEVASLLKIDKSLKLEISGHTDNTGSKDHNLALSQARAQAVVQVLVTKYGIDPKRLTAKGYGDTKPVAPNTTDDNKAKNRRVELRKI